MCDIYDLFKRVTEKEEKTDQDVNYFKIISNITGSAHSTLLINDKYDFSKEIQMRLLEEKIKELKKMKK